MILDSSVVIAMINPLDVHCGQAVKLIASNPGRPRILHEVSLAECLVRSIEQGETGEVIKFMESMEVEYQATTGVAGALRVAEIRMKSRLPLSDCYVIDAALMRRLSLASFDEKLNQAARELGIETVF